MTDSECSSELEIFFHRASKHVASKLAATLGDADLLALYARYKQATEGICNTDRPGGWFDSKGKQKWDAWSKLGKMSREKAMEEYVDMVEDLDPDFQHLKISAEADKMSQFGISVSTLRNTEVLTADEEKTIFDWAKEGNIYEVERRLSALTSQPRDDEALTPLHWASDQGHVELIKKILERFPDDVNAPDSNGLTPLHYASCCCHTDAARLLLEYGADPAIKDNEGSDCVDDIRHLLPGEGSVKPKPVTLISK